MILKWAMLQNREAPPASARGIFTASAKPAEAYPTTLLRSFEGYPFRIHPRPSGRGILQRRVRIQAVQGLSGQVG